MAPIHNRMPVILEPEEVDRWIEGTPEEAKALIAPAADGVLQKFLVSTLVNNARVEDPQCAEPSTIN